MKGLPLRKKSKGLISMKGSTGKSKSKFEEFLAMDMKKGMVGAEEDLAMERRLAKKLKVKGGKLKCSDDGIGDLIEAIPSVLDSMVDDDISLDDEKIASDDINGEKATELVSSTKKHKRKTSSQCSDKKIEDEVIMGDEVGSDVLEPISSSKRRRKKKSRKSPKDEKPEREEEIGSADNNELNEEEPQLEEPKADASAKYVAPHLRACANKESEELSQIRRRIRGLLNRLSESNVESVTEEVATIFRSLPRSVSCQIINEEVIVS